MIRTFYSNIVLIDSQKNENAKIVLGDLYDEHNKIVTAVLLLTPTSIKGNKLDLIKISSAEGRGHIESLFRKENGDPVEVRYFDKKRIQDWLNVNRLQLPLHSFNPDSLTEKNISLVNNSIPQNPDLSSTSSKKLKETTPASLILSIISTKMRIFSPKHTQFHSVCFPFILRRLLSASVKTER